MTIRNVKTLGVRNVRLDGKEMWDLWTKLGTLVKVLAYLRKTEGTDAERCSSAYSAMRVSSAAKKYILDLATTDRDKCLLEVSNGFGLKLTEEEFERVLVRFCIACYRNSPKKFSQIIDKLDLNKYSSYWEKADGSNIIKSNYFKDTQYQPK